MYIRTSTMVVTMSTSAGSTVGTGYSTVLNGLLESVRVRMSRVAAKSVLRIVREGSSDMTIFFQGAPSTLWREYYPRGREHIGTSSGSPSTNFMGAMYPLIDERIKVLFSATSAFGSSTGKLYVTPCVI